MPYRDIHVLIVEDDTFQRSIIAEMLRAIGLNTISEASNGAEALTIIRDEVPKKVDLIISDLKMPEMDGMEFLRRLGEAELNIEMIVLSAMDKKLLSTVNRISESYQIKLLGVLEKPITMKKLHSVMARSGKLETKPLETNSQSPEFSIQDIIGGLKAKQFIPYLQPKVDLKSGRIIGAEALARWSHPTHGIVLPYAFIDKLEENKLIDDLTFVMLKETAAICQELTSNQHNIQISVNLSLMSLEDPEMARKITSIVTENGGDPKRFILEITESIAMKDTPVALENLARLSMNGFTLSIDDYGTGYSNLHQLTHIDFGELKLDRSLVHGVDNNESMKVIVASNIKMADTLGIKCVGEGIEDKQDWEALKSMGCHIGQGYHIAKPMSVLDFYDFIEDYAFKPIEATPKKIQHFIQSKTKEKSNENKRILVVQHDQETRDAILKVLINLGYQQAMGISDAQAAIDLFETEQFDLIFTDIFMPEMNGLDLIKRIRTNKTMAKPNTRIIVLSGIAQSKILGLAMALNVSDFFVQPIVPDVIDEKISQIIKAPCKTLNPIAYETINVDI